MPPVHEKREDGNGYFEQMKGRGVRVIDLDALRSVTPDANREDPLRHGRCGGSLRNRIRRARNRLTGTVGSIR